MKLFRSLAPVGMKAREEEGFLHLTIRDSSSKGARSNRQNSYAAGEGWLLGSLVYGNVWCLQVYSQAATAAFFRFVSCLHENYMVSFPDVFEILLELLIKCLLLST